MRRRKLMGAATGRAGATRPRGYTGGQNLETSCRQFRLGRRGKAVWPQLGERNHECFSCEALASSAQSRRQKSQQMQRLSALLGQALAGLDCRSLQRGQRGVLERCERAGVSIVMRTGVNGDRPAFETHE